MGRYVSSRATRGTVMQRCSFIEESMLRNLEECRAFRLGIDEVKERRSEQRRKFLEEIKQKPEDIKLCELTQAHTLDPAQPTPKECQSMKERMAAVEHNMESNQEAMGDHRKVLSQLLALQEERRAVQEAAGRSAASGSQALAAAAREPELEAEELLPPNDHVREIELNSKWMGPAMQKSAVSKAKVDEAKERSGYDQTRYPTRPGTPEADAASTRRPMSAAAGGSRGSRPRSAACSSRPQSAAAYSRPVSAAMSRGSVSGGARSRPSSASSLTSRFRNIQENVDRNQEMLQSHRVGIEMVTKTRQERAQKMTAELLSSIKTMYEQREAERRRAGPM